MENGFSYREKVGALKVGLLALCKRGLVAFRTVEGVFKIDIGDYTLTIYPNNAEGNVHCIEFHKSRSWIGSGLVQSEVSISSSLCRVVCPNISKFDRICINDGLVDDLIQAVHISLNPDLAQVSKTELHELHPEPIDLLGLFEHFVQDGVLKGWWIEQREVQDFYDIDKKAWVMRYQDFFVCNHEGVEVAFTNNQLRNGYLYKVFFSGKFENSEFEKKFPNTTNFHGFMDMKRLGTLIKNMQMAKSGKG